MEDNYVFFHPETLFVLFYASVWKLSPQEEAQSFKYYTLGIALWFDRWGFWN